MGAVAEQLTEIEFDQVFSKIASLYDHAEKMLQVAHHPSITDHEAFIEEIEDLVCQIEESANIIAEDFGRIIESGKEPSSAMKIRVSSALRKILLSIEEYRNHVNARAELELKI